MTSARRKKQRKEKRESIIARRRKKQKEKEKLDEFVLELTGKPVKENPKSTRGMKK